MNLSDLKDVQTTTWITHALGTAIVPWIVALFFPVELRLGIAAGAATVGALYFSFVREPMDEEQHRKDGDYDTPDGQGITPRIDQWGDMLGPVSVAVTYILAWVLTTL